MAECGWKGPFDTPCHFTANHGSAHSQMGGSEDDRYGSESRYRHRIFNTRQHADTRTTDQKLEAMAAPGSGATEGERRNAEHLLFKRRQRAEAAPKQSPFTAEFPEGFHGSDTKSKHAPGFHDRDPDDRTQNMSHTDFMNWMRRQQAEGSRNANRGPYHDPAPHVYTASRGDTLGCDTCARSKDNKRANHIKQVG